MRSELAHDIFRQDFAHIYEEQNQVRGDLKSQAEEVMRQMTDALRTGTTINPVIEKDDTAVQTSAKYHQKKSIRLSQAGCKKPDR